MTPETTTSKPLENGTSKPLENGTEDTEKASESTRDGSTEENTNSFIPRVDVRIDAVGVIAGIRKGP